MFGKRLRDEHRTATTPPATRSSTGAPSFSDQRGKRPAASSHGSSSKKPRPSSSAPPPSSSVA
ncbi:UNVERIFIED_CONTAM: hypothetical protein Sradi_1864900 [Sesamum radiatum]|uniref:Uncharacterized protein n=1 Tax=Sesamum radiatum TaxID=300843 RepID=A0AAW2TYC0_SESRA